MESIVQPSKFIDPKYVTYLIETTDGRIVTGLLASKTDKEIVLKMAGDKEVSVPASKVATFAPQQKSLPGNKTEFDFNWAKPGFPGTVIAGKFLPPVHGGMNNINVYVTEKHKDGAQDFANLGFESSEATLEL